MNTKTIEAPRARRRRALGTPAQTAEAVVDNLTELTIAAYAAKVAADEAEAAAKKAKAELHEALDIHSKTEHFVPAAGNRPNIKATITAKTTNTVNVDEFAAAVTPEQFRAAASVKVGEAEKILGKNALARMTYETKGNPYVALTTPKK